MAWSTSQGNRGYIFLISAMKVIYLVVTSAYCISFSAVFLTSMISCHIFKWDCINGYECPAYTEEIITGRNWINYGIYACFVAILTVGAYFA